MIDERQTKCLAGHAVERWIVGHNLDRHCNVCVETDSRFAALVTKEETS